VLSGAKLAVVETAEDENFLTRGPRAFAGRNVLLLQGPFGPFFRRFAVDLMNAGAQVLKVNFNAGDALFYPFGAVNYRGTTEGWPAFLEQLISVRGIDAIIMFGDCREMHQMALSTARRLNIEAFVFEEGYVRPDYVTLERHGVNGFTSLPRDPNFYRGLGDTALDTPSPVGSAVQIAVVWGFFYYLVANFGRIFFRHYRHHRGFTLFEAIPWWISFARKYWYLWRERGMLDRLTSANAPPFYLVPLQVFNDTQLHIHSNERSVEIFIQKVATSFSENAPKDSVLVLKHHPMDRGYITYARFIRKLSAELALGDRIIYIHDQHLPTLLGKASGLITINSTVGMSALLHEVPVVTLGRAFYDIAGLTHQGALDTFWTEGSKIKIEMPLFRAFRSYVINSTQLNGNFYKRTPGSPTRSGLIWPLPGNRPQQRKNVVSLTFLESRNEPQLAIGSADSC
jgi:capsular polysaccharide export protein